MNLNLETTRLRLRPPETADIAAFALLIGNFRVAKNLSGVPYRYTSDSVVRRTSRHIGSR